MCGEEARETIQLSSSPPLSFQTCVGVADPGKEKSRGQKNVIPLSLTLELPFFS